LSEKIPSADDYRSGEGKLRTRSWQDKDSGNKRYKTEVEAMNIVLLGKREESSATSDTRDLTEYGRGASPGAAAAGEDEFPSGDESGGASGGPDDDVPF